MSELGDLLNELDFEDWVNYEGLTHKLTRGKSGTQINLRECPSCGNTKWKVYVGTEHGIGNCFVCERKFTKWNFISDHLNVSGGDTMRYLTNYMKGRGWMPRKVVSKSVRINTLNLPESIPLPIKGKNLKYLANRNITLELAKYFHLRYCHEGRFDFYDFEDKPAFQDYSRRIIIPVFDETGKLATFQGRDITGEAEKKYLFPPGFASTGSLLYNQHNATEASRIVIGEGAFDAFAIKAAMDEDTVLRDWCATASFGKKLSFDQIAKLRAMKDAGTLKEVIFMWDAEQAAVESAVDAAKQCAGFGLLSRIALLPPGRDPNEVAPQVVRDALWNAVAYTPQSAIKLLLQARKL